MRTSRTTLAALAALPLVAALAACSTAPSASAPEGSASAPAGSASAAPQPSGSTSASGSTRGTTSASGAVSGRGAGSGVGTTTTHRPTVADALDTVRSYMTREVGMTRPVTGDFRWTGAGTGEVPVRARLVKGGLGPATTVSVTRLRTVWYVTAARTDGITVDRAPLARPIRALTQVSATLRSPGIWRVEITQDRYGPDVWLGGTVVAAGAGHVTAPVTMSRATATTGSVIFREKSDSADGTLRTAVVRVRFVPGPPPAPCTPSRLLPVLKGWFDQPADELSVAKVKVLGCRGGYAHVVAVPRINPEGHSQYDPLTVYLQDTAGQWRSLDYGSDLSCEQPELAAACRALGEVK